MTPNRSPEPIKISTLGISEKMSPVLDYFFKHTAKKHCQLVDTPRSEAIIIDIDSIEGKALFRDLPDTFRDKPLIVLSVRDPQQAGVIHVQKPLNAETLLSAIDSLRYQLPPESGKPRSREHNQGKESAHIKEKQNKQDSTPKQDNKISSKPRREVKEAMLDINLAIIQQSQQELDDTITTAEQTGNQKLRLVVDTDSTTNEKSTPDHPGKHDRIIGSAPDIDLDDTRQIEKRSYNPDDYFQGFLFKTVHDSRRKNKPAMLNISEYSIVTLPDANTALIDLSESQLQALSSIPLSERTMTVFFLEDAQLERFRSQSKSIRLYSLLWKAAIMASRGRIPFGTNIKAPVYLKNWSNIAKHLLQFQHAEEIARLWEKQPVSLEETINKLKIPQRHVFTFYSACRAIGIASTAQDADGPITQQGKSSKQNVNIMNKLIRKFKHS